MLVAQPAGAVLRSEYSFNAHISSPTAVQVRPRSDRPIKHTFTTRPATINDAPAIASLGSRVFSTTFGFSIPPCDLKAYLDEAYSTDAVENDVRSASTQLIVACAGPDDRVIGFAQLTEFTSEPCIEDLESIIELQRLYVDPDFHGSGIGKTLTKEVEAIARGQGYRIMWLGVWEGNFKAQRVYEAMGFTRVGEHEFKMGRCIQTDWIMIKDL
ncbi:acyl-CoA N-acyltransferase [Exophiala viscosa]|uniref:acyl-CoA N-acyltransferase n=1 Tax=Exophiala viscosa TaxID=2486360 RepID=UPI00219E6024|nr:acyl-CoA N-acyltransferase [Exophiala viscosa]